MADMLLAGVVGWPIKHSQSPKLHGYWLRRHDIYGAYLPFPVAPSAFSNAVKGLAPLGFRGVNVTIPHKEQALALSDRATETALRIGAANMLTVAEDGKIEADNSDAYGFIENLRASAGREWVNGPCLILGAGGVARAVAVALQDAGVDKVWIVNRTADRAAALAATLGGGVMARSIDEAETLSAESALIVNCTSIGMGGRGAPLDFGRCADATAIVVDTVYTPVETPFLMSAKAMGLHTVDGLGMLIHQARPGFTAWFGATPEPDATLRKRLEADIALS